MDIKECRAYVRQCVKDYPANSFILELDSYPLVKCVIIHNDHKTWGYFREGDDFISLDRSNKLAHDYIVNSSKYHHYDIENVYIISSNKEVKRVYEILITNICKKFHWQATYFNRFLKCNPRLITNLWDLVKSEDTLKISPWEMIFCQGDLTTDNIHKAFNLPVKYALIYLKSTYLTRDRLRLCANNNIPAELVAKIGYDISRISEKYITHKLVPYLCSEATFSVYLDYVNMRDQLPESIAKDFPIYPALEKLQNVHDRIIQVYYRESEKISALKNEENNTRYKENYYPKACEYEYSNDKYSIIACKSMEELTLEGTVLHHCVGSYINSVSHGKEYILFLRNNEKVDIPYFTIDIDLSNNVRQIHGKYNCNIDNELKPFIDEWAKKFNLDISNCNGVRCALG